MAKQWKDWEKQQKALKAMKDKGTSAKEAKDKAASRAKREAAAASSKKDKKGAGAGGGMGKHDDDDDKGEDLIPKPREYRVSFAFNDPAELPPPILSVTKMGFRYGPKYPWLFKGVDCGMDQSSRISIVGPNGVGKSTFLSLLIGDLEPSEGEVVRNRFLRVGKYSQHFVDILPMGKTPVEYLQSAFSDLSYQGARGLLGRFGLEGHAHTIPVSELSGGQKARVVFAGLSMQAPHVMVLDEPSNKCVAAAAAAGAGWHFRLWAAGFGGEGLPRLCLACRLAALSVLPLAVAAGARRPSRVRLRTCLLPTRVFDPRPPSPSLPCSLDAESIDALADAISAFQGGVVLVSHDARLIRNAGCQLWVCDKQNVKPYPGDLDDYKESLLESIHKDEEALDAVMAKRAAEEEAARMAATKERARKLRELREKAKADAAAGAAPAEA